jgi:hypothetical protein
MLVGARKVELLPTKKKTKSCVSKYLIVELENNGASQGATAFGRINISIEVLGKHVTG